MPHHDEAALKCLSPRPAACLLAAVLAAGGVSAQAQSDSTAPPAPVELAADSAEVNDLTGVSVYRGDVILTRGPVRITGDIMRAYTDADRQLERVVVEGAPATYRETLPDARPRRAEAPRMEYHASGPERLILLEGARLWQGDNTVTGATITHYPGEERTLADGGDADGDGRGNVRGLPAPDDNP